MQGPISLTFSLSQGTKKGTAIRQSSSIGTALILQELVTVNTALKVLREPGKRILEVIVNKGGEVLQGDLYLETDFSKAKVSRTLRELKARNIIQRRQYGGTKKVILSDWMRKETVSSLDKPLT
jgi:uncharacterized membrane protein